MPDHVHLFAAENELQGYPLGQWVAKMEGTCLTPVAIPKGKADLAEEFLGSSVEERRQLRRQMAVCPE
jgi:hypothetical protein